MRCMRQATQSLLFARSICHSFHLLNIDSIPPCFNGMRTVPYRTVPFPLLVSKFIRIARVALSFASKPGNLLLLLSQLCLVLKLPCHHRDPTCQQRTPFQKRVVFRGTDPFRSSCVALPGSGMAPHRTAPHSTDRALPTDQNKPNAPHCASSWSVATEWCRSVSKFAIGGLIRFDSIRSHRMDVWSRRCRTTRGRARTKKYRILSTAPSRPTPRRSQTTTNGIEVRATPVFHSIPLHPIPFHCIPSRSRSRSRSRTGTTAITIATTINIPTAEVDLAEHKW